jgi:predicted RNA-binding Zn-ribbon protein involved in translation (DUF1610 family)
MRESREQQTAMYDQPDAPWIHDSCDECGWDGDAAIVRDPDQGLMGFDCPQCSVFVVARDLENDN